MSPPNAWKRAALHTANRGGARAALLATFGWICVAFPPPLLAQGIEAAPGASFELRTLFELGQLVTDPNGDSVPEFVDATWVLGPAPSRAQLMAATEMAARVGFETVGLDLPLPRTAGEEGVQIVVGRDGLAAAGLSGAVDPDALDAGEGAIHAVAAEGQRYLVVLGGDDAGLMEAARTFAAVLPHTRSLSSPTLGDVVGDVRRLLSEVQADEDAALRVTSVHVRGAPDVDPGRGPQVGEVVVDALLGAGQDIRALADALRAAVTWEGPEPDSAAEASDSTGFDQPGLERVHLRLAHEGGSERTVVVVPGRAVPPGPGPISGRPGGGAKDGLDLSTLYTARGLLGDSDSNLIPDRIDALVVPGSGGLDGLPDLGARLGLESTGLVVPLVVPDEQVTEAASEATLILVGAEHARIRELADSGRVHHDSLAPGEGLVEVVPRAFGSKPALVVTGADSAGAARALKQVAHTFPHLDARGKDRPVVEDVEQAVWATLSGDAPAGQAATGLYKLDRIRAVLADTALRSVDVLVSVEHADPALERVVQDHVARMAPQVSVRVDNRDVEAAGALVDRTLDVGSEVARLRGRFEAAVLPAVRDGQTVVVQARVSEPPELRRALEDEFRQRLTDAGADPETTQVEILSAFKQGYSWLYDRVRPRLQEAQVHDLVIRFRKNEPPVEWPQQAIHTPLRWLHEIFPVDEVLAGELDLPLERIRFEMTTDGPTYQVEARDAGGSVVLTDTFEPAYVLRPYFDRFEDYEHVRVTTGWLRAHVGDRVVADERIRTDPEAFWDAFQSEILSALYDHVMQVHEGLPNGGSADAPYFGTLEVEATLSEPDYRIGVQNEIHAPMDALHEEVYFGVIEFFQLLGRNSRGQELTFPGRVIPRMEASSTGGEGQVRVRLTGFATARPSVQVRYVTKDGHSGTIRRDIPVVDMERPSARRALVRAGEPGIAHMDLRVRVDSELDLRDSLLVLARGERIDATMISAEQVEAVMRYVGALRDAGAYRQALAIPGLGSVGVWAEWVHEQDPEHRRTAFLGPGGDPPALPDSRALLPDGWSWDGGRMVQWDTPIPPPEGHGVLARMGAAFPEATVYRAGESYLGRTVWAMDLMSPVTTTHWSHAKATTFKPTVIYSARQHANEVSSTSHVLRHAELLLTDPEQRSKLDRVNVVIHPFTNPDGAQLAYDLYTRTPDYILHAGYLASLGQDVTAGSSDSLPIYPESHVRNRLWNTWLPDIFLNPHGYPSHQVVQLFSEYTGLVRRGRVTERNWGFNKGWFMPGFGYVDDPDFPRHLGAAMTLRDYITRGINSNEDVVDLNRANYARYERYGARFDPDVFRIPLVDSVLIEMPLEGSSGSTGGRGFNSNVTIWSGTTEAPDETAYGPYLHLVARAGLSWDQAILDYLVDGNHQVKRSGTTFFGGTTLRMVRPRPPEDPPDAATADQDAASSNPPPAPPPDSPTPHQPQPGSPPS